MALMMSQTPMKVSQPDDEPNQPPVDRPAEVVPPDRDFFSYLDYTIGIWKLGNVEAFIKQNI